MGWREWLFGQGGQAQQTQGYVTGQAQQQIANAQSRPDPRMQAATLGPATMANTSAADQFRARQMGLADSLGQVASGQTAGAGELAAQRQGNRQLAQVAGAATMARGAGAGGARAAARGAAGIGMATSGQAQQAAMGDQQQARGALGSVLGQGREGDLSTAFQNQGAANQFGLQQGNFNQQAAMQNLAAQLQARGYNDQQIQAMLQQMGGIAQTQQANHGTIGSIVSGGAQALGIL